MKVSSVRQMQEADRRAINELGIPGCVLMYNAGKSVVDFAFSRYSPKCVGILAGKGNNAGDGFVIAHLLHLLAIPARVICLAQPDAYSGDALLYLNLCQKERLNLLFPKSPEEMVQETQNLRDCDLLVDALLGTGARGAVREPFASVIKAIPEGIRVIAVDLPSGMDGDTGEIGGVCVKASATVTFAAAKQGLLGKESFTGELIIGDIGMPDICLSDEKWDAFVKHL
jgi:NAD(P)H-hydrate epimerase